MVKRHIILRLIIINNVVYQQIINIINKHNNNISNNNIQQNNTNNNIPSSSSLSSSPPTPTPMNINQFTPFMPNNLHTFQCQRPSLTVENLSINYPYLYIHLSRLAAFFFSLEMFCHTINRRIYYFYFSVFR